ncbi:hypothetical protein WUBG_16955, partial [Wuchereria bancrofti]
MIFNGRELFINIGIIYGFAESLPAHSFPLFVASVSQREMFASSPLSFIKSLCSDILLSLVDLSEPPQIESSLTK